MDVQVLRDLRERVMAAEEPDWEIDADIVRELKLFDMCVRDPMGWSTPLTYTTSIEAARALVNRVLPDWWVSSGTCNLTGHASIGPDYNGPERARLFREFPEDRYHEGFHADLTPGDQPGREAQAIIVALLEALIAIHGPTT